MRITFAQIWQETHTFSPIPTGLEEFKQGGLYLGNEILEKMQELADFAADRLVAFHATLTAEQREKVAEHIEEPPSSSCRFFRH